MLAPQRNERPVSLCMISASQGGRCVTQGQSLVGSDVMVREQIGQLPPHYSLLLNPYTDVRLSKCPRCEHLTHPRKFALFILIKSYGPLVLGKTCRYCTGCELVIVHQDELEAELARSAARLTPEKAKDAYLVIGTVERRVWQKGLTGSGTPLCDALQHMADFKKQFDLHVEPGGWRPAK